MAASSENLDSNFAFLLTWSIDSITMFLWFCILYVQYRVDIKRNIYVYNIFPFVAENGWNGSLHFFHFLLYIYVVCNHSSVYEVPRYISITHFLYDLFLSIFCSVHNFYFYFFLFHTYNLTAYNKGVEVGGNEVLFKKIQIEKL